MTTELRTALVDLGGDLEPRRFFAACADVARLGQVLGLAGPDVLIFAAADSEVDDLLVGADDALFEPSARAERDAALRRYAATLAPRVREAAARLLRQLDAAPPRPGARTVLRYVGNFQELGWDDDPDAPTLVASRGKRGADHKRDVVAYLRAGHTLTYSPGSEDDVLDPSTSAGSLSTLTDGTYAWPARLAHYVERHDVLLPADFEAHMAARGWQVPASIDVATLARPGSKR